MMVERGADVEERTVQIVRGSPRLWDARPKQDDPTYM